MPPFFNIVIPLNRVKSNGVNMMSINSVHVRNHFVFKSFFRSSEFGGVRVYVSNFVILLFFTIRVESWLLVLYATNLDVHWVLILIFDKRNFIVSCLLFFG